MCLDLAAIVSADYMKHVPCGRLKGAPLREIQARTKDGPALYYPSVDVDELERRVLEEGRYARTSKRATVIKIFAFDAPIGASDGDATRYVQVECTSGFYHGRPVAETLYEARAASTIPCCDEVGR